MTQTFKFAIGSALAMALACQPAFAQAARKPAPAPVSAPRSGPIVPGVGVADLQAAMAKSNAYRVAQTNRQNTYRPTVDAAQARARQIDAQLKPLIDQFNADRAAKKPEAVLQGQLTQIQTIQAQGEAEIKTMLVPIELSEAYVREQIADKMGQAVNNVMSKRGITLLLGPDAVILASQNYDVTDAVVAELNVLCRRCKSFRHPAGCRGLSAKPRRSSKASRVRRLLRLRSQLGPRLLRHRVQPVRSLKAAKVNHQGGIDERTCGRRRHGL